MKSSLTHLVTFTCLAWFSLLNSLASDAPKPIDLWPSGAPGEKGDLGEERDTTKPTDNLIAGKPLIRLGNVTKPTISIYRPAADKNGGAAVVVCPGGGYTILALDLEGTEVCEWLNSIGVTGVLLKYRVPKRPDRERYEPPLQDAQRALGLVRQHAKEWNIDPQRVGVLGFSAGAHLCAALGKSYGERTYSLVDDADNLNCRPDFQVLIYPGGIIKKDDAENKLGPEVAVTTNTPPTFLAMAQDDPVRVENAVFYALALKNAKVPVELHVYPTGGHGYGLRPTKDLVTTWPNRVADWMEDRGLLKRK
jgi:acetyl esterase/lipase